MTPSPLHNNVLSWASTLEPEALLQAERTARLPFVDGHLALMPDAHFGLGATVGSVIPTRGAIIPAAIGVDIGCGMIAAETSLSAAQLPDSLDDLLGRIARKVPSGVGKGHEGTGRTAGLTVPIHLTSRETATALNQYGSLGSGNHFVEVCLDDCDVVWVVLHSGSRGIGNQLAKKHIEGAKGLMKRYFVKLEDPDLAYLTEGTDEFKAYIADMLWCQDYALGNRQQMMDAVLGELFGVVAPRPAMVQRTINCHHNFTQMEHHRGHNMWLTRKGAIKAGVADFGVIPGSMGTSSYIVRGKGNPASYHSCAHGAGRRMSRKKAKEAFTVESLRLAMEGKAWNGAGGEPSWADASAKALLDEHPGAYKDIDEVMADQDDLVEVEHSLHQILNYKGA